MNRYGKMVVAVMTISLLLFLLERVLPVKLPLDNQILLFLCYLYGNWQVVYFTTPKTSVWKGKEKRIEYLIQGNGRLSTVPFDKSKYRDYKQLSSDKNGSTYASPEGALMCTKYVSVTQSSRRGEAPLPLLLFCVLWAAAAAVLYDIAQYGISGRISADSYWEIMQKNVSGKDPMKLWGIIWNNLDTIRMGGLTMFRKIVAAVQNFI